MSEKISETLKSELLCIADSNWVLGHWYIICMLNGRELTDFTSIAGIAEEKLGHTRALFRYLEEELELPELQLEFGRSSDQIQSLQSLDAPPTNWADFIIALFLADAAVWRFSSTFKDGSHVAISSLVTKFGEEAYFHQLCIGGWLQGVSEKEKSQAKDALLKRLPSTLSWFSGEDNSANDPLLKDGIRSKPVWEGRGEFVEDVLNKLANLLDLSDEEINTAVEGDGIEYDLQKRRPLNCPLPDRLWEHIIPTSANAEIARRPLSVSVTDNIDLFQTAKKDETEPVFEK